MNQIEQLEQEIARLQRELEALKAAKWPQNGDTVFILTSGGEGLEDSWTCSPTQLKYLAQGNIFRTEEEAKQEAECRAIIAEYRRQPGRKAFVLGKANWCAYVGDNYVTPGEEEELMLGLFQAYFIDQASIEAAIKAVGEDRLRWAATWQASQGVV